VRINFITLNSMVIGGFPTSDTDDSIFAEFAGGIKVSVRYRI
jgi:hypothetical protein